MDIIIDWQPFEMEFAGEKISMELRPLKSYAMFMLAPYLVTSNPKKDNETLEAYTERLTDEDRKQLTENSQKIQELTQNIFPDHVRNLEGITVNKKPVTWEQIATEIVFANLAVEICGQLASISTLKKDEEKNSKGVLHLQTLESVEQS